jgi:hypothetical protein
MIAGMIAYCCDDDNRQPKTSCCRVTPHNWKAANDWQDIAKDVFNWMAVDCSYAIRRLVFMVNLVNHLVERFGVKQSVRVVKANLLTHHANGQINHDSREVWKFA